MEEENLEIKKYDVTDAIWLAAAILSYEKYKENPKATIADMYFTQKEIKKRAQTLANAEVQFARISEWCCGDSNRKTHSYLRAIDSKRRLAAPNEFDGNKTMPENINMEDNLPTNTGTIKVKELWDFVNKEYKEIINNNVYKIDEKVDCIGILEYLDKYAGEKYIKNGRTEENEAEMEEKAKAGRKATAEFEKMYKICKERFGLVKDGPNSWLNQSGQIMRNYLWIQLKREDKKDRPESISLFAEPSDTREKSRFRFSLEIHDAEASKIKGEMEKYHKHLELPINTDKNLVYISLNNAIIKEPQEEVIKHHKEGKYQKVQISRVLEWDEDLSNEKCIETMLEAVESLLPYYEYIVDDLEKEEVLAKMENNIEAEEFDKNIILYGPPGTGKTYNTAIYAVAICDKKSFEEVKNTNYKEVMKRYKELKDEGRIEFTTFHQSYGYEEFIEGIKPVMLDSKQNKVESNNENKAENAVEIETTDENKTEINLEPENIDESKTEINLEPESSNKNKTESNLEAESSKEIKYKIEPGIFKEFCENILKNENNENQNYVFIIDEINRGNISKIFGELITSIEVTKRLGEEEEYQVKLPYSKKEFGVPNNVYLIGTMNTADRSIALMDTALRRRFQFIEMMPETNTLKGIKVGEIDIAQMLDTINKRIEVLYDRDHTIGHAIFMELKKKQEPNLKDLANIFKKRLIPLLKEYFYDDYAKIQLILGEDFVKKEKINITELFNVPTDIDLPEEKYTIQEEALNSSESYIKIYK